MVQRNETVYVSVKHSPADEVRILGPEVGLEAVKNIYRVGSSFRGSDINRGLTLEEEAKLLPNIISSTPTSPNWNQLTREYWANISVTIPVGRTPEQGKKLEVGLVYNNEEDAAKGDAESVAEWNKYKKARENNIEYIMSHKVRLELGTPINLVDYILYRYLLVYGKCANTPEEKDNSPKIVFFLTSESQRKAANEVNNKLMNDAMQMYLSIATDTEKLSDVLAVLRKEQNFIPPKGLEQFEIQDAVRTFMTANPGRFIAILKDSDLMIKAFIYRAIDAGVLRRLANSDVIMYGDHTKIGQNLNEAVDFINNPENAEVVVVIKAQMV